MSGRALAAALAEYLAVRRCLGFKLARDGLLLGGWCRTAETSVGSAGWVGHTGSHAGWAGAWSRFG